MPLILPGNVATATASTAYSIDNSCRFNDGDSVGMSRTMGTPTDADKWTFSCWIKRGFITDASTMVFYAFVSGNEAGVHLYQSNGVGEQLRFKNVVSSATEGELLTNRQLRDVAAWYHIVYVYDSGNATAGNRMRIYVNGVEETSFVTDSNPDQDQDSAVNSAIKHCIGSYNDASNFFDGYIAECVFCDGQAYAASDFGEFDEDSPTIWKPKDPSGLTFGNNGFWLDFEDSSALGNDVSGNNNDFGQTNLAAADQCQDSPTNNFVTLNPLNVPTSNPPVFSEGNTSSVTSSSGTSNFGGVTTIGLTKGKWYVEAKAVMGGTTRNDIGLVANQETIIDSNRLAQGHNTYEWSWEVGTPAWRYETDSGAVQTQTLSTYANGDIIALYLDLDNHKLYAAKNGTIQNSGTGLSIPTAASTPLGLYYFVGADSTSTSVTAQWDWNFGNGSYAGTAVSSAVADANGYGKFEYDPSDGGSSSFDSTAKNFYAICTKNLAEFG